MANLSQRVLELVREARVLRPRDLDAHGIPRTYLSRLVEAGKLTRISRGLYTLAEADVTEHQTLIEASKKLPNGVICLLSALRFHELTTVSPHEVWMAIGEKDWKPRFTYPPVRLFRFSDITLSAGVNEHIVDNCPIRVFSEAKTVADCFKYRNKVGIDLALEALRECWRQKRATADELWHFADLCRVKNIMRPYLETIIR